MSKKVRSEAQDAMSWLKELVTSNPEAQAAYEDEVLKHTWVPKSRLNALEVVAGIAMHHLDAVDKHIGQLQLWRNKPLGSKEKALYDEHLEVLDGWRSRLQDALLDLEHHEYATHLQKSTYVFSLDEKQQP